MSFSDPWTAEDDSELAELLEGLTNRQDAGECLDLETCCGEHPRWAEQLRALLPVLQRLQVLRRHATDSPTMLDRP